MSKRQPYKRKPHPSGCFRCNAKVGKWIGVMFWCESCRKFMQEAYGAKL